MSSTNVEVNGTELDPLNLTLHDVNSDFVCNDGELPVPVKDAGENLIGNFMNSSTNMEEVNATESEELNLTLQEVKSDFVCNEEEFTIPVTVLSPVTMPVKDVQNGVRSPRVSPVSCSQNDGLKLKRNIGSCKKISSRKNKKQRKGKRVCLFVGEPVSETEAKQRWGWRYELKVWKLVMVMYLLNL